jgi:2-octaprenyl-6-methoxyphenol hydroxylase
LFDAIGVWDQVAAGTQPILDMVVTDSKLEDATRPVFLTFAGDVEPGEPFAHMVENRHLIDALVERAAADGVDLRKHAVTDFASRSDGIDVTLADGSVIEASLLVAADGARSKLRERAGIATHGWDYDQSGIVVTVGHERDHHGRAEEHFLPSGPFAILPLTGMRSSLVWTEKRAAAARIAALPEQEFHTELERRFGLHLGEIAAVGPRRVLPLGLSMARAFIADRLALVGDAAHVIHPIAGQGLNMGLKDVAALAEVVVDAARLGMDLGQADVLDRYQRWRRFDTMAMGLATNSLNLLFSNKSTLLRTVRDIGLGLVDRAPPLKSLFIRQAAGLAGEVPRLLKGEAL